MSLRLVTVEDALAGARALAALEAAGADARARRRAARLILARAETARAHRRRAGRAHPEFGDGSIAAAAASLAGGPRSAPDCAMTLRGAALFCALLARSLENGDAA